MGNGFGKLMFDLRKSVHQKMIKSNAISKLDLVQSEKAPYLSTSLRLTLHDGSHWQAPLKQVFAVANNKHQLVIKVESPESKLKFTRFTVRFNNLADRPFTVNDLLFASLQKDCKSIIVTDDVLF